MLIRPCGKYCDNYGAELAATQKPLNTLGKSFEDNTVQPTNIVNFSDSQAFNEFLLIVVFVDMSRRASFQREEPGYHKKPPTRHTTPLDK